MTRLGWDTILDRHADLLHQADDVNLAHQQADAEYLPPSPVARKLRDLADAELAARRTAVTP